MNKYNLSISGFIHIAVLELASRSVFVIYFCPQSNHKSQPKLFRVFDMLKDRIVFRTVKSVQRVNDPLL